MSFLDVAYPLTSVEMILIAIVVCSHSIFFCATEIAFVNDVKLVIRWFFKTQLSKPMNFSIIKFPLILHIASFKIVGSLSIEESFIIALALVYVLFGGKYVKNCEFSYTTA